ncbi:MAG: hypothetical protein CVU98_01025 [Firmicutes bacterium HGW-Firmicutes-3]|jgi:bifunctional DNA-binding transcriptional regulator/antitoxin component of YhaV-PrlF toxin-antitoxin module|nr:MAG: hypothetical protein CVU98_01025 [Firmicutes bacterium HGW-Firmicutes-3]
MDSLGIFEVNEDGSIEVPAEILENLGYGPDESPLIEVVEDGIIIHKKKLQSAKKKTKNPKRIQ